VFIDRPISTAQEKLNHFSIRNEIFEYIEICYNRKRIHSSLDNKSPMEYELAIKSA